MYSVRAPSMLTSSMISRYFSCQSLRTWLSTYRSATLDDLTPLTVLSDPPRGPSFEKPQAEWIITPLIRAAAVPDVAVTSRRCEMLFPENNSVTASMTRDFPVPPSPPDEQAQLGSTPLVKANSIHLAVYQSDCDALPWIKSKGLGEPLPGLGKRPGRTELDPRRRFRSPRRTPRICLLEVDVLLAEPI